MKDNHLGNWPSQVHMNIMGTHGHVYNDNFDKKVITSRSESANVLGNMPGKNLRTNGNKNSANGTMTNTRNGTSRNRSAVVRTSCHNIKTISTDADLYQEMHQ